MKILRLTMLGVLLCAATSVCAQKTDPVRCVVTLYRLSVRDDRWRLIKSFEFLPKVGEEELTNKTILLPGSRKRLFASVFPTDESMHSAKGADSIKLGLAISSSRAGSAFDIDNNAVAETTFAALDTLRVERATYVNRRPMLTRLECWDPNLEKKVGSN